MMMMMMIHRSESGLFCEGFRAIWHSPRMKSSLIASCCNSISAPSGGNIPVSVTKISAHSYEAAFQPKEVGPQQVAIFLGDEPISGSPYVCNVFDVNRVSVSSLGRGSVGKPVTFGGK